jgi:hypothetical protein
LASIWITLSAEDIVVSPGWSRTQERGSYRGLIGYIVEN